ncbi:MAG: pilus assembly protein PilM [Patescibacteria group bacterium]|nr:pilus assembly protein PilM [Patescibacteria group bacterium]
MFLCNPFAGAFGLDIGDLSIKIAQMERRTPFLKRPYFELKKAYSVAVPPGYIINGEIQELELVREKLLFLLGHEDHREQIKDSWVVASLPEPKTFLKLLEIEIPPEEITENDIIFHAQKHLPFDPSETYLDWQILDGKECAINGQKISKVLIGAAPKIIADSYTNLLESVGLGVMALEVEAVSLARAMITSGKNYVGEARAMLDLGATRSTLVIYDHGAIQFSTILNFSGELLTTAIAQELKLTHPQAEKLKIKNGISYDRKYPKYLKTVSGFVDELASEIKKSLFFYKEHFLETNPVTHITLSGGGAGCLNLGSAIARKLKISATPGHPWKNLLNPEFESKEDIDGLTMASAIGLALRAAEDIFENEQKVCELN